MALSISIQTSPQLRHIGKMLLQIFAGKWLSVEAYREDVVANICREVVADIKWDDSHVQGHSKLCQAIYTRIQQIQASQKPKVCLVGFYGIGGVGKTTISKTLCHELYGEFEGKVSHIEFGRGSFEELLKKVLKELTNTSEELLHQLSERQCQFVFRENMSRQRVFLAIDNVWDDFMSIRQTKMYLQAHFHEGSVVMVTSRSSKTLTYLGIKESHCFEMPELEHKDAKNLFLYHAAYGTEFLNSDDECAIEECVSFCYFRKGDNEWPYRYHYLPLALKALGVQMGHLGNEPSLWKKSLPRTRDFNYLQEEENPVFSILRSSFDRLGPTDQSLFMDVVLYTPSVILLDLLEWLSLVYNQDLQEIETRLLRLKEKGLLEDVNMTSRRGISVHDLYIEFAKLESQGKLNESADFELRKWVYYENTAPTDLEMTPSHRCWPNLFRIGIEESGEDGQQHLLHTLQGIEWQNCSNVVVLKLKGLKELRGDLNLKGLKCLRSLELFDISNLESLDGLQDLNHLTYFRWVNFDADKTRTQMGQLPASLQVVRLHLSRGFFLRPDAFSNCTNLWKLELWGCRVNHPDFSNCKSLRIAELAGLETLEILSGLTAAMTPKLQSLEVRNCDSLVEIPGLGDLVGLELLYLYSNLSLRKLPDMQKLTRLQVLEMSGLDIEDVPGLGCLLQLRELQCRYMSRRLKLPNLSALKQLEAVDFSGNDGLSSLEGVVESLFALRVLDVSGCGMLRRLPDLSGMSRLEELDLTDSGVEIGEEDVCMLAKLPLLHPVQIGRMYKGDYFRLDVVRRKVLKWVQESQQTRSSGHAWAEWTRWQEQDLGMLPIAVLEFRKWQDVQF